MDPQRHTLRGLLCFTRISYPAGPLGMVSVEKSKWVYRQNEKIKSRTISSDPVYSPTESSTRSAKAFVRQLLLGQSQGVNILGMTQL